MLHALNCEPKVDTVVTVICVKYVVQLWSLCNNRSEVLSQGILFCVLLAFTTCWVNMYNRYEKKKEEEETNCLSRANPPSKILGNVYLKTYTEWERKSSKEEGPGHSQEQPSTQTHPMVTFFTWITRYISSLSLFPYPSWLPPPSCYSQGWRETHASSFSRVLQIHHLLFLSWLAGLHQAFCFTSLHALWKIQPRYFFNPSRILRVLRNSRSMQDFDMKTLTLQKLKVRGFRRLKNNVKDFKFKQL